MAGLAVEHEERIKEEAQHAAPGHAGAQDVCSPSLTVWWPLMRKSSILLHIDGVSPCVWSLSTSLFSMMVLNMSFRWDRAESLNYRIYSLGKWNGRHLSVSYSRSGFIDCCRAPCFIYVNAKSTTWFLTGVRCSVVITEEVITASSAAASGVLGFSHVCVKITTQLVHFIGKYSNFKETNTRQRGFSPAGKPAFLLSYLWIHVSWSENLQYCFWVNNNVLCNLYQSFLD